MAKAKPKKSKSTAATVTFIGLANDDTHFQFGDLNQSYSLAPVAGHQGYFRCATDENGPYRAHATILLKVGPPNRVILVLRSDIVTAVPFDGYDETLTIHNTQVPSNGGVATVELPKE